MVTLLPADPEQILRLGVIICISAGVFGLFATIALRFLKSRLDDKLDNDFGEGDD